MKVLVHTPTARPGFDVTLSALERQTHPEFSWALGDNLYKERKELVEQFTKFAGIDCYHYDTSFAKKPGKYKSLVASYNTALKIARENEFDLFISLQDYIWIPDDGITNFVRMARRYPSDLLTGLTSISEDPEADKVVSPEGLYTVFGEPYTSKPQHIFWEDARIHNYPGYTGFVESNPIEYEWNWAAIPRAILLQDVWVDEDFDAGIAYENQAFAYECIQRFGCKVVLDLNNHALSLPHKRYPLGLGAPVEADDMPFNVANRELMFSKWGSP